MNTFTASAMLIILIGIGAAPNAIAETRDPSVNGCVSFDHNSNSLATFAHNSCGYKVYLTWSDDRHCRSQSPCSTTIGAYGKQSITKVWGAMIYGACKAPALPKRAGNGFYCVR